MLRIISLLGCLMLTICLGVPSALAVNKALSLDGDGDYVEIVDSPILNNLESQITIEAWIRADGYPGEWMSIIYKGDEFEPDWANRSFTLWLNHNGYIHFASAPSGSGQMRLDSPNGSIQLDTWYHVSGIIDSVNHSMKLLINGNEVASRSFGNSIRVSSLPLRIGWTHEENTPHSSTYSSFTGQIDEVRIWNVARTQEEIQVTMNTMLQGDEAGLVGYWKFDDGTTDDSSTSSNDGTLYGDAKIVPLDWFQPKVGDVSGDGTISAYDAALILQYVIGLIDKFPATSPISQAAQKYISGEISIDELDSILQKWGYPSVFKLLGLENQLLQNYPNPFNPETWIPFKLAQSAPVTINIYDVKGQLLRALHIGNKGAGIYVTKDKAAYWDGMDTLGEKVGSGIYFYTLQAGDFSATRKMLIVK